MKCFLLNSPIYRECSSAEEEYLPPLGLGYIATHIFEAGIEVEIIDCVKERYGVDEVCKLFKEQQPTVIGINIFTQNYEIVKEIVEKCPIDATIIIGGQVVKCLYKEILTWNTSNRLIQIIGEGELILPSILTNTCKESPFYSSANLEVYRVDKKSIYYPCDLDQVHLNRAMLKDDTIVNHYGNKEAAIITSRGCMYNCAFCGGAYALNQDITVRYRDTVEVEFEINQILLRTPNVTSIRILDDLFLRNDDSIKNAINLFEKYPDLSWRGMAHVLTFTELNDTPKQLKESGCRELFIGIESGSEIVRKMIRKPGSIHQIINVISELLKAGIGVKGYFIIGFPQETNEDAEATIALASKLKLISHETKGDFRISVFQFRPYHGTALYNQIEQSGREIVAVYKNNALNAREGRSQFNFQSGNYSDINDDDLNNYILRLQKLSEDIL